MLEKEDCGLLIIDVQGQLARMVQRSDLLVSNTIKLIRSAQVLSIPIVWIEQNPQGLGPTIPEISGVMKDIVAIEKFHFGALSEPAIESAIAATQKKRWLVAGIESHVCVYQSVMGLLSQGFSVDVVTDCVSSRLQSNIDLALVKMKGSGANMTSVEMCIFELMKTSKMDKFSQILSIIK